MNYGRLHALTFDALYLCLGLLTFVLIERLLYHGLVTLSARRAMRAAGRQAASPPSDMIFTRSLDEFSRRHADHAVSRSQLEDLSSALVLGLDARLNARLWILDTIVTAAPLLGLMGTIFGIMQTFGALSAGGISDPASVSRGIGTALQATAFGIGTALYGLIAYNWLHRQSEHLSDQFKICLLRMTG